MRNRLPITVSSNLWDAMADDCGVPYADSYLSGASELTDKIIPHTVTAHGRLRENAKAMALFERLGLRLVKPLPYGDPGRPDYPEFLEKERVKEKLQRGRL